ncbi:MAG: winged helix-turn-helix domain-containing protein [Pseudomonadota bacterium]
MGYDDIPGARPAVRSDEAQFGPWVLNVSENRITNGVSEHTLEPLAIELLTYLAHRSGAVVSLDELHAELWAGRIVTDSSIYRQIAELRRVLGDDARAPRYIETVRKRGYRLIPAVRWRERPHAEPAPRASIESCESAAGELSSAANTGPEKAHRSPLLQSAEDALATGFQRDNLNLASDRFSAALNENPASVDALAGRAVASIRLYNNYYDRSDERLRLARADITQALELDPLAPSALFAAGYFESVVGDPEQAFALLERTLARDPHSSRVWQAVARSATRCNDLPAALEAYQRAFLRNPTDAMVLYDRGMAELMLSRFRSARQSFLQALELNPEFLEAHIYLGVLELNWLGDREAAARQAQPIIAKRGYAGLFEMLLLPGTWSMLNNIDALVGEALEAWSTEANGGDAGAWRLAIGTRCLEQGRQAEAQVHFEAAAALRSVELQANPTDAWLQAELGIALACIGQGDKALAAADRAVALAPVQEDAYHNADFLWLRCLVLVLLERWDQAVQAADRACRYFSTITPQQLLVDPLWRPMTEQAGFLALMNDDRTSWQALEELTAAPAHRSATLARLIETHS